VGLSHNSQPIVIKTI